MREVVRALEVFGADTWDEPKLVRRIAEQVARDGEVATRGAE